MTDRPIRTEHSPIQFIPAHDESVDGQLSHGGNRSGTTRPRNFQQPFHKRGYGVSLLLDLRTRNAVLHGFLLDSSFQVHMFHGGISFCPIEGHTFCVLFVMMSYEWHLT